MMSKVCFRCKEKKPISAFYRHPQMADGHLNKCKVCARLDVRINREKRRIYYTEKDRERNSTRYFTPRAPHKKRATRKVYEAVKKGLLVRGSCELHGSECRGRIEGHHDDYRKPLVVRWLCKRHHAAHHAKEGLLLVT